MLMDIKCSAIASIKVDLTFDDGSRKERVVGTGDLISAEYNANGLRKRIEGKVIKVSAIGPDPKAWYIIVDGSDDFESERAKFAPTSILDLEIIRKADTLDVVQTVIGVGGVPYIRIHRGRLQWSKDGYDWRPINVDRRDIIEDAEGTMPIIPNDMKEHAPHAKPFTEDNDCIEDADW